MEVQLHLVLATKLPPAHREAKSTSPVRNISDFAHVRSPSIRLDQWPLGIVTHVFTSSNGISRSVKIRTVSVAATWWKNTADCRPRLELSMLAVDVHSLTLSCPLVDHLSAAPLCRQQKCARQLASTPDSPETVVSSSLATIFGMCVRALECSLLFREPFFQKGNVCVCVCVCVWQHTADCRWIVEDFDLLAERNERRLLTCFSQQRGFLVVVVVVVVA